MKRLPGGFSTSNSRSSTCSNCAVTVRDMPVPAGSRLLAVEDRVPTWVWRRFCSAAKYLSLRRGRLRLLRGDPGDGGSLLPAEADLSPGYILAAYLTGH